MSHSTIGSPISTSSSSSPSQSPQFTEVVPQKPAEREALFVELRPLVRSLTRQYGVDADLREELPGEIYCHFVRLLDTYDPSRGVPLRPYVIRGLKTAVYTTVRSCWRRRAREVTLCRDADGAGFVDDPAPRWDHAIWQEEVFEALPPLIQELPPRQRNVLIWRYFDERSFEEIADHLKVRPSTVRSLLRHGINSLRRKVTDPVERKAV